MSGSSGRRLDGIAALITGAASGIGRATAEAFHGEGAQLLLVDVDGDGLDQLVAGLGDRAAAHVADLGAPGGARGLVAVAERIVGPIDLLVNDAGVSSKTPFLDVDGDEWDRVFDVNVHAAVELSLGVAARMAERRHGCILNVSSISGRGGGPSQSVYGISKGALLGLTMEMAVALAPRSVRVNAVLPGVIDTSMVRRDIAREGAEGADDLARWIEREVPMGRIGLPAEVARVLLYLASADGAAITGAFVPIDGGFLAA